MNTAFSKFRQRITNRFFFRGFLLSKLPAAFFAGLRLEAFDENKAVIAVKQKWFNKNPFRSIYFAVLTMAGEMSTGVLGMANIYKRKPTVSMLIVEQRGLFHKKATGKILFICEDGIKIKEVVDTAVATGNPVTVICYSKGINSSGEMVAELWATWSFKARNSTAMPLAVYL